MRPPTRKGYWEIVTVGRSSRLIKKKRDMGTALALGERDPHLPLTNFLETKLCLGTYASLQDDFMDKGSLFADQVLALIKTMYLTKVFGNRNQWDNHMCRQLIL